MNFLIIDHIYHKKTKSSDVLIDIINQFDCNIEVYYVNPDEVSAIELDLQNITELASKEWDAIFLWQIDYLGSYFSRKGHRVIIFPMADASLGLPDEHWRLLDECNFICFSLNLHSKISQYTQSTRFYQFYPETYAKHIDKRGHDSAFFWLRDQSSIINLENVIRILPSCVTKLHVHSSEENRQYINDIFNKSNNRGLHLTVSSWFDSKQDYLKIVENSLFFIAPRESEGIGLSFVEALQMNRIVIAHDSSTHNEYISNFENGILVNFHETTMINPILIDEKIIDKIIFNLNRQHAVKSEAWTISKLSMLRFIESVLYGEARQPTTIKDEQAFVKLLLLCHTNLREYHDNISKLISEKSDEDQGSSILSALKESARLFTSGEFQKSLECIKNAKEQNQKSVLLDLREEFIMSHVRKLKGSAYDL